MATDDNKNDKKVDESWKEEAKKDNATGDNTSDNVHPEELEVTFPLFASGLMMEGMIALGEIENPVTKKKELSPAHAKFIINTLAMLKEKTDKNLSKDEADMLEAMLYELRMRYISKTGAKK